MNCIFCACRSREWKLKTLMEGDISCGLSAAYHLLELREFRLFRKYFANPIQCLVNDIKLLCNSVI